MSAIRQLAENHKLVVPNETMSVEELEAHYEQNHPTAAFAVMMCMLAEEARRQQVVGKSS